MTYQATKKQLIFNDYLKDPNTTKDVFDWEYAKNHISTIKYKSINIDDIDIIITEKTASHNNIKGLLLVNEANFASDKIVYQFIEKGKGYIFKRLY